MKFLFAFSFLIIDLIQISPDKNYLLGKFEPSTDHRFVSLSSSYAKGSAVGRFLRKEAFDAFQKMADAAKKDTISLFIVSATRNFDYQKKIWQDKWTGKVHVDDEDLPNLSDLNKRAKIILKYSAMPGTSRHHWGSDVDINSTDDEYFLTREGTKVYNWLNIHAPGFGFCQPYSSKTNNSRTGYEEEKWHWSYVPLSTIFLDQYKRYVSYADISGFEGSETAMPLQVIELYVNGVVCR